MHQDIKNWCDSCEECCKRNDPNKYTHQPMVDNLSTFTWQIVGMDITGPLPLSKAGNRYILVIQDYFSKFVVTMALENITENTIKKAFLDEFSFKFGMPISVHTDMGMQFQSAPFKEVLN
ncbi:Protein NYNRIN [Thelohanellus kitauei]|uniref:Protein NYNRIN n=1 Tax=Thelohanellus kitauei TaxID=669202 RepID=A0A0C2IB15_THEKT|nr:Protein NYNRIN [Thelohanellus kitauei]